MKRNGCGERVDTGKTHIGYDFHYVVFLYKGFIIHVNAGTHYPFTDENYPGAYNFTVYLRVGLTKEKQTTYAMAYKGLASIDEWIGRKGELVMRLAGLNAADVHTIEPRISDATVRLIQSAMKTDGAYRERSVFEDAPVITLTETWNREHQVVEVIGNTADESGHRDSFLFDCVTRKFC